MLVKQSSVLTRIRFLLVGLHGIITGPSTTCSIGVSLMLILAYCLLQ